MVTQMTNLVSPDGSAMSSNETQYQTVNPPDMQDTQPLARLNPLASQSLVGRTSAMYAYPRFGAIVATPHLVMDERAFARLRTHLRRSNRFNWRFDAQFNKLASLITQAINAINAGFSDKVDSVWLDSEELARGISLNRLSYDAVTLVVVLRPGVRTYLFARAIARAAFAPLEHTWIMLQVMTVTHEQWQHMLEAMDGDSGTERNPVLTTPLLRRD